jgi:hypothetical protein
MNIVISNWKTWESYSHGKTHDKSLVVHTTCPGVLEGLRGNHRVLDLSQLMSASEANKLGEEVFSLSEKWKKKISFAYKDEFKFFQMGKILGRNLPMVMNTLVYHYKLLELKAKENKGTIYIPYMENNMDDVLCLQRATIQKSQINWFGIIAQSKCIENVKAIPVREDLKKTENTKCSIFFNSLLIKLSTKSLFVSSKLILKQNKLNNLYNRFWAKNKTQVFIFLTNDLIFSVIPGLMRKRVNLSHVQIPKNIDATDGKIQSIDLQEQLTRGVTDKCYKSPLVIASRLIESYINHTILPAVPIIQGNVISLLAKSDYKKHIFLTNSLGGPLESIFAYAFKYESIPIISSQHGAIGLLKQYEIWQQFSSMVRCDYFICFNSYERDFFLKFVKGDINKFYVYGVLNEHKGKFSILAKYILRRRWKVGFNRKVVMYLPTSFRNGQITPYDNYDMNYWQFIKELVFDVLSDNNAFNVIKLHQKGINNCAKINQRYKGRHSPWLSVIPPKNVAIHWHPQFDYSRYVADILIIDRATSTLGWALASNIPLIYIDSHHSPLIPSVKKEMEKSVFLVDAHELNWKKELTKYTSMNTKKMLDKWMLMKPSRDKFISKYVLGSSSNDSTDIVDWILTRKPI